MTGAHDTPAELLTEAGRPLCPHHPSCAALFLHRSALLTLPSPISSSPAQPEAHGGGAAGSQDPHPLQRLRGGGRGSGLRQESRQAVDAAHGCGQGQSRRWPTRENPTGLTQSPRLSMRAGRVKVSVLLFRLPSGRS